MKIYITLFFLLIVAQSCAQKLSKENEMSRLAAENVIDKYLKNEVKDKNYIVFSSGDIQFVVLVKDSDSYHEYFIDNSDKGSAYMQDTLFQSKDELFKKMFDLDSYHKSYTSFDSEFYKNGYEISSGNITYFALVTKDRAKYGESRLSFYVKPNPIDAEVYLYFTERLLKWVRSMH